LRGAALLAAAVTLGVILLNRSDSGDPFSRRVVAGTTRTTTTPRTSAAVGSSTSTSIAVRPPAQVKVLAANGTSTKGLAGRFKDKLSAAGYNALAPTDASKKPVAASTVYFQAGYETEARAVAALVQVPVTAVKPMPQPPPVASLQGANVLVVVGQDKAGAVATTTARHTSTTAAHTSTSGRPATSTTATSR